MAYVNLKKFGKAWVYQCKLSWALDNAHVLAVTYNRWQGQNKLNIFGKVLLWDEEHLFDLYEFYCFGTDKEITERMVLFDDAYAEAPPSSIPEKLKTKLLWRIG